MPGPNNSSDEVESWEGDGLVLLCCMINQPTDDNLSARVGGRQWEWGVKS